MTAASDFAGFPPRSAITADAHLAALPIEHSAEIVSYDRDLLASRSQAPDSRLTRPPDPLRVGTNRPSRGLPREAAQI